MKRHFCIDPMTILVSHQSVPPTFYNKIVPMHVLYITLAKKLNIPTDMIVEIQVTQLLT